MEASKAVPLKGVSRADCVWNAGDEVLSYSVMTASSDATVVDLSLSVPAQVTPLLSLVPFCSPSTS